MKPPIKSSFLDLVKTQMGVMDQVECPVTHNFADGIYVREMHAEKGTIILGKRHRFETCNVLLKGKLKLYMGEGVPDKVIEAPMIFNSNPGVRKLAYVLEDTIFLNIHPTKETDLEKIEGEFIIPDNNKGDTLCLG